MNQKIANYAQVNFKINNEKIDVSIYPSNPEFPQLGALNAPLQHQKKLIVGANCIRPPFLSFLGEPYLGIN
jgi:hypothetical protein